MENTRVEHTSVENKEVLKKLDEILSYIQSNISKESKYESENTNEINAALAKAQIEYPVISLNRVDKYLNNVYTDLDMIMCKIRPILGKHEISITQRTLLPSDGRTLLQTRIWHSSGQWIESIERIKPDGNDIVAYNSNLNEIKKSQILALLNVTIKNDAFDDNGYEALRPEYEKFSQPVNKEFTYDPKKESYETINKDQVKELQIELAFVPGLEDRILKNLSLRSITDIPDSRYFSVRQVIMDNKEAYLNKQKNRV